MGEVFNKIDEEKNGLHGEKNELSSNILDDISYDELNEDQRERYYMLKKILEKFEELKNINPDLYYITKNMLLKLKKEGIFKKSILEDNLSLYILGEGLPKEVLKVIDSNYFFRALEKFSEYLINRSKNNKNLFSSVSSSSLKDSFEYFVAFSDYIPYLSHSAKENLYRILYSIADHLIEKGYFGGYGEVQIEGTKAIITFPTFQDIFNNVEQEGYRDKQAAAFLLNVMLLVNLKNIFPKNSILDILNQARLKHNPPSFEQLNEDVSIFVTELLKKNGIDVDNLNLPSSPQEAEKLLNKIRKQFTYENFEKFMNENK